MPFDKIYPFTERVVAFLDILGFSQLIKDAERLPHKRDELFGIFGALNSHVKFDNESTSGLELDTVARRGRQPARR